MVRLYIWTVLVLGSQAAVAVTSWSDRAAVDALTKALRTAMVQQSNESAVALQLAVDNVTGMTTPILVTTIAALVATIGWLHSAAVVVDRGRLGYLRHGTGWAIGAWFVPILNLVRVPSIAADVFRAARTSPPAGLVVGLWWLLWIGDGLVGRLAAGSLGAVESASDFVSALSMTSFSDLLSVGSAAMTLTLVLLVTTGLRNTRSLVSSSYEFEKTGSAGFPEGFWGTPSEPVATGAPTEGVDRFGAPAVPDSRFGTPAPAAPVDRFGATAPTASLAGPPEPWLAPRPVEAAPSAAPVAPVTPAEAPLTQPVVTAPQAAPTDARSPYPTTGVFYPQ